MTKSAAAREALDDLDAEIAIRDERIEQLETELKEAKEEASREAERYADLNSEHQHTIEDLGVACEAYDALVEVKYWMQGIFQGGPMRDPRKILRIVERALEP